MRRALLAVFVSAAASLPLAPIQARIAGPDASSAAVVDAGLLHGTGRQSGIVLLRRDGNLDVGVAAARAAGLDVGTTYPPFDAFVAYGTSARFRRLARDPSVRFIEANERLRTMTNTSHEATRGQDVLDGAITMPAGTTIDGRGVGIAIVDSGVDGTHPDLVGRMGGNVKIVCSTPFLTQPGPSGVHECTGPKQVVELEDSEVPFGGHGTHVAGAAAGDGTASDGEFHGAAPGATIYGVATGSIPVYLEATMDGMAWVLENHDQVDPPIKVVNTSWGAGYQEYDSGAATVWRVQEALIAEGVTVVTAAGNEGGAGSSPKVSDGCVNPTPGVICVANYDDANSGTRDGEIQASSSRGAASDPGTWPDLAAPGTQIVSTCRYTLADCWFHVGQKTEPPNTYATLSGTSMASPHVAGIVAQLLQVDPMLTPGDIEDILEDTAYGFDFGAAYETDPYNDDGDSSYDKGHGLVDVVAAINEVLCRADPECAEGSGALPRVGPAETLESL